MRTTHVLVLVFVALLMPLPAGAQQRPLDTQDPEPVGAGRVAVESGVSYARDVVYPLSGLRGDLYQAPLIDVAVGVSPIAAIELSGGPYDRLRISARQAAPLAGSARIIGGATHAVDDLVIGMKLRVVPETAARPAFAVRFAVRLPNAKHTSGLGQDTTDFTASVLAGKAVAGWRAVGNLGVTIMSEPLNAAAQNDVLMYGASLTRPVGRRVSLVGEANGRLSTRPGDAPVGTESRAMLRLGGRYRTGRIQYDLSVARGLTAFDPSFGVAVGVRLVWKAFALPAETADDH